MGYRDLITPCPESQWMMVLNCWWPGLGIACSCYYGKKGNCDLMVFGLGAAVMFLSWLLDMFNWFCLTVGFVGWNLGGLTWVGLFWNIIFYALCLGWPIAFLGWCLMMLILLYTNIHMWFCLFAYTDMVKAAIN